MPVPPAAPRPLDLLLASASPRRQELLRGLGLAFTTVPARVEEWEAEVADPAQLVQHNAQLKAAAVAREHPQALVLGADTTVALKGRLFHKPADLDEARAMLRTLSGETHTVSTGVALRCVDGGVDLAFVDESRVSFHALDEERITDYFTRVNPLDKAGAYGIQEARELVVAGWEGSLHTVMGLPTERLRALLEAEGLWARLAPAPGAPGVLNAPSPRGA